VRAWHPASQHPQTQPPRHRRHTYPCPSRCPAHTAHISTHPLCPSYEARRHPSVYAQHHCLAPLLCAPPGSPGLHSRSHCPWCHSTYAHHRCLPSVGTSCLSEPCAVGTSHHAVSLHWTATASWPSLSCFVSRSGVWWAAYLSPACLQASPLFACGCSLCGQRALSAHAPLC
jgi:hypothetical protein